MLKVYMITRNLRNDFISDAIHDITRPNDAKIDRRRRRSIS